MRATCTCYVLYIVGIPYCTCTLHTFWECTRASSKSTVPHVHVHVTDSFTLPAGCGCRANLFLEVQSKSDKVLDDLKSLMIATKTENR